MKKYIAIFVLCFCSVHSFAAAHLATRATRASAKAVSKAGKVAKKVAVATYKTVV